MCLFLTIHTVSAQAVFQRGKIKDFKSCQVKQVTKQNHPKHCCAYTPFSQKMHKDKRHIKSKHAVDNRKRHHAKAGRGCCK